MTTQLSSSKDSLIEQLNANMKRMQQRPGLTESCQETFMNLVRLAGYQLETIVVDIPYETPRVIQFIRDNNC